MSLLICSSHAVLGDAIRCIQLFRTEDVLENVFSFHVSYYEQLSKNKLMLLPDCPNNINWKEKESLIDGVGFKEMLQFSLFVEQKGHNCVTSYPDSHRGW